MAPRSRHPRTKHLALTLVLTIVGGLVVSAGLVIVTLVLATNISDSALRNKEAANTAVTTALTEEQAFTLPENTSNVPELLDESTLVDVVAKTNQRSYESFQSTVLTSAYLLVVRAFLRTTRVVLGLEVARSSRVMAISRQMATSLSLLQNKRSSAHLTRFPR